MHYGWQLGCFLIRLVIIRSEMCMPCAPFRILAPQATAYTAHSIDTHVPTFLISLPLLGALWEKMVLSL